VWSASTNFVTVENAATLIQGYDLVLDCMNQVQMPRRR